MKIPKNLKPGDRLVVKGTTVIISDMGPLWVRYRESEPALERKPA